MDPKEAQKLADEIVKDTMKAFSDEFKALAKNHAEIEDADWEKGHDTQFFGYLFATTFTNLILGKGSMEKWQDEKDCVKATARVHAELSVQVLRVNGRKNLRFGDAMLTLGQAKVICIACTKEMYAKKGREVDLKVMGWICNF